MSPIPFPWPHALLSGVKVAFFITGGWYLLQFFNAYKAGEGKGVEALLHASPNILLVALCIMVGLTVVVSPLYCLWCSAKYKRLVENGALEVFPAIAVIIQNRDADALGRIVREGEVHAKLAALRAIASLEQHGAAALDALVLELQKTGPPDRISAGCCEICGVKLTLSNRHLFSQRCAPCTAKVNGMPVAPVLTCPVLAAEIVGKLGACANSALPTLRRVATSKDPSLARACSDAIERIEAAEALIPPKI